ncbi:hypothetical protein [Mesorhizobium sp. WSM3859]|uniref:hypothetical protein n=1 Tax=Mesorhizobium sp. WSM3859 TaxID=2029402 RepID=UPI000BB041AB|nr:hypothetical protein [Mesorhizobium sp. WSM3859]
MDADKIFDELEAELHREVGRMVATWSQLEGWLAHILTLLLVRSGRGREGETIYYEVPNLRPRIAVMNAAFFNRSDIGEDIQKRWSALIAATEKEAVERNSIVHGDFLRGTVGNSDLAVAVSPKVFSDMRRKHPPKGVSKMGFHSVDIRRHTERVALLRDALWALYGDLPDSEDAKPPRSAEEYLDAWRVARGQREWPSVS